MRLAKDIIEEIEARRNKGLGLEHFKEYMQGIGNPQKQLRCIHVAGTNGKGSTVNYLRSVLQCAGYKVGTFTSPYLETHYDRIRINDCNLQEDAFLQIATTYYESWIDADLNMFEIDMAIASLYFLQEQCDICIFEVGLGGRLDATNILQPIQTIITNIGMDHMDRLGDTYALIAKEKAGIVKPFIPLISGEEKQECMDVFQSQCEAQKAKLHLVKKADNIRYEQTQITFGYRAYKNITIPSGAHYQVANASLALEAIYHLQESMQIQIPLEIIQKGCSIALWKGRFEVMHREPLIIIDGAHNEEGIIALQETLATYPHVHILFAALKDKETDRMLEHLLAISEDVIVTQFDFYRVKPAKEIAKQYPVQIEKDYQKVIRDTIENKKEPLIITGSLYFISEVRKYLSSL